MLTPNGPTFNLFSAAHISAIAVISLFVLSLFIFSKRNKCLLKQSRKLEKSYALSILLIDVCYHLWLINSNRWSLSNSLPLELCSISLVVTIVLLWTGNKKLMDFMFFAGIGGAMQALLTPELAISFPHLRYFHFFYTHSAIILTALYFVWFKNYRPTFKGLMKTMLLLNLLLPIIFLINTLTAGNYMFLQKKPSNDSLLDILGPYPWYILSLELVALFIFIVLWLLFRRNAAQGNSGV